MDFMNEYFMKFCGEEKTENCRKTQCQYKLYCSRYKYLQNQEKENGKSQCKSV